MTKDETLSGKVRWHPKTGVEILEVTAVQNFINKIKTELKNLNYHEDAVDEISEMISEQAGVRFK